MKTKYFGLMLMALTLLPAGLWAWPGMETPPLHVEGRYLKDACGNTVNLHGVGITVSPWFNGCMYGNASCRWNNYDVAGVELQQSGIDRLTNTADGWYINYIRLHFDPTDQHPGPAIGENDIRASA